MNSLVGGVGARGGGADSALFINSLLFVATPTNLTELDSHTRIFVPHLRKGTGDASWATSNQKEVFTGKAVRLLFEIAARPILFLKKYIYNKTHFR